MSIVTPGILPVVAQSAASVPLPSVANRVPTVLAPAAPSFTPRAVARVEEAQRSAEPAVGSGGTELASGSLVVVRGLTNLCFASRFCFQTGLKRSGAGLPPAADKPSAKSGKRRSASDRDDLTLEAVSALKQIGQLLERFEGRSRSRSYSRSRSRSPIRHRSRSRGSDSRRSHRSRSRTRSGRSRSVTRSPRHSRSPTRSPTRSPVRPPRRTAWVDTPRRPPVDYRDMPIPPPLHNSWAHAPARVVIDDDGEFFNMAHRGGQYGGESASAGAARRPAAPAPPSDRLHFSTVAREQFDDGSSADTARPAAPTPARASYWPVNSTLGDQGQHAIVLSSSQGSADDLDYLYNPEDFN